MAIFKEAEVNGVTQTIRRHGIYAKLVYPGREQLENLALKKLVAEKELVIAVKDEL